jgi:hypothetical protein
MVVLHTIKVAVRNPSRATNLKIIIQQILDVGLLLHERI